jgi:hypothetical protein
MGRVAASIGGRIYRRKKGEAVKQMTWDPHDRQEEKETHDRQEEKETQ